MDSQSARDRDTPGLIAGVGGIAKSLFGLLQSRLELAALELGEVRDNLARLLLLMALAVVAVCFAAGCGTALIVVLTWDVLGWKILLLLAAGYALLAAGLLLYARAMLAQGSLAMPATMAELRKDRDALL